MKAALLVISSLLELGCYVVYIRAILQGKAKPHRTTRLVLLVITTIVTAALFAQGNRVAIWLAGVGAALCLVVFLLSLKHGMGGWARLDIACMIIALAGIVLWQLTDDPAVALYASIGADFTAMVPTLIKTYRYPDTEVWYFNGVAVIAAFCNMLATEQWTFGAVIYPLYLSLINLAMVILILRSAPGAGRTVDTSRVTTEGL